ncbi:hypothetical protein MKX67_03205 [Cytobacillus sp. FSL W7-1323]|uniref:DUF5683 domain-containing protein n=1 Tax=Cytobacillus kochii TaxID=859143 RepID=A0A248TFY8_9BACI|nr:hypothetical protein [Cytobacillus kochii]ASV67095.1 hypothetical protein CKF48_06970 [Cytobacillus kochii]
MKYSPLEKILWSIALPGLGQYLNGKLFKGTVFLILEIFINIKSHFNEAIIYSFKGDIPMAIEQTNYHWLMFYPCLYFYAIWDAYKESGVGSKYSFIPFVFSGYFVTAGLLFSVDFTIFGILLGPVWLPMLCVIPGIIIGNIFMKLIPFK